MKIRHLFFLFFLISLPCSLLAQLPDGFVDEHTPSNWDHIAGYVFDEENRMFAWERAGRLYRVVNDQKVEPAILDISEEVAFFLDHGMLSVVLHPNFINNGYVYLNYAVDRHHLIHFGTGTYSPTKNATHEASIGRLTRYTLDKSKDFAEVIAGSRKVLIGDTKTNGVPLLHGSHGVGDMVFGTDGSLLVAYGDGSSFEAPDAGSHPTSYYQQALADGIIREAENVGAYRSQLLNCLNGKILRIDPETGEGLASNPFYDATAPLSPQSRVWSLGFRNPFRLSLVPGTGKHDPNLGDPGQLLVGDVGGIRWEELNHVTRPGQNFGWPLWEGFEKSSVYRNQAQYNKDMPNPMACQTWYYFHDLAVDSIQNQISFWANPCDENKLIENIPLYLHTWPVFAYNNIKGNPPAKTQVVDFNLAGKLMGTPLEQAIPNIEGEAFEGNCIIDGAFGTNSSFPSTYQDAYFFGDYSGWIKAVWFDSLGHLIKVENFHQAPGKVTHLDFHPVNGCMYVIDYKAEELNKICFDKDPAPLINLYYDKDHGPSPLTVSFDASSSRDPAGQAIEFHWDFGDGTTSTDSVLSHTFIAPDNIPTPFEVKLTVRDSLGNFSSRLIGISVNNSPPKVSFSSFKDGDHYAINGINILPLEAEVIDLEHQGSDLSYAWQVLLHHNTHFHPEAVDTNRIALAYLSPAGCEADETFFYRVTLTVEDAAGLATHIDATLLPNCDTLFPQPILNTEFIDEKVHVDWEIADSLQDKIEWMEIQRAPDRLHFETIGDVVAQSNSFTDFAPLLGQNVYRLKIFTQDDKYFFSHIAETIAYEGLGITIYPNPASNILAFGFEEMKGKASFELIDLQGRTVLTEVWQGAGKSFRQISIIKYTQGLYFYRLTNGSRSFEGKLIIK